MPPLQNRVNNIPATSLPDGQPADQLGGKAGEAIIAELHGKYYTQTYRGNVFVGSTAIGGVVPPAFNATAQVYMIWNPQGSGKNLVPINITLGYISGTSLAGNLGYSYLTGMGTTRWPVVVPRPRSWRR
jgi:hypothetical protein